MAIKQATKLNEAVALIPEGATLMIAGFMGVGSPSRLLNALAASGKKGFTIIANDTARPGIAIGRLIDAKCVKKVIASHIGTNPETQRQMIAGEIEVELCPQGSLAERIRAGGAGLGGVLTRTGLGTLAAEGKPTVVVGGETWVIETALRADFALIHSHQTDYVGNSTYSLTATNFNPLMALAADTVIVDAKEIVPVGLITPDAIRTPGILVDHILERAA